MKYFNQILILSLFLSFQCKAQDNDNRQLAMRLNDQAIDLMHRNPDYSLLLLDSAIKVDSQFVMAYSNKVTILCQKGEYHKAVETLKKSLLLDSKRAEAILFLGMLYEKTGQINYANIEYLKAVDLFTVRLQKEDKFRSGNRLNRAIALILLGKDEGRRELNTIIDENPKDEILSEFRGLNRQELLDHIFPSEN